MKRITNACLLAVALSTVLSSPVRANDFSIIKDRVIAELMKPPVDDDRVAAIIRHVNEDGSFDDINYTDLSRTAGFPQRNHTANLVALARAYKSEESQFHRSRKLKEVILTGAK